MIDLKLPSSIRITNLRFDEDLYEVEEPIKYTSDKGIVTDKICAIDNIIRWRFAPQPD